MDCVPIIGTAVGTVFFGDTWFGTDVQGDALHPTSTVAFDALHTDEIMLV